MTYIILLAVGIILIIISFAYIIKQEEITNKDYDNIEKMYLEMKKYNEMSIKAMNEFEELIDLTMDKMGATLEKNNEEEYISENRVNLFKNNNDNKLTEDEEVKKILELKEIGLTNKEIAQKLNKGIREIDIILKINKN